MTVDPLRLLLIDPDGNVLDSYLPGHMNVTAFQVLVKELMTSRGITYACMLPIRLTDPVPAKVSPTLLAGQPHLCCDGLKGKMVLSYVEPPGLCIRVASDVYRAVWSPKNHVLQFQGKPARTIPDAVASLRAHVRGVCNDERTEPSLVAEASEFLSREISFAGLT